MARVSVVLERPELKEPGQRVCDRRRCRRNQLPKKLRDGEALTER